MDSLVHTPGGDWYPTLWVALLKGLASSQRCPRYSNDRSIPDAQFLFSVAAREDLAFLSDPWEYGGTTGDINLFVCVVVHPGIRGRDYSCQICGAH